MIPYLKLIRSVLKKERARFLQPAQKRNNEMKSDSLSTLAQNERQATEAEQSYS